MTKQNKRKEKEHFTKSKLYHIYPLLQSDNVKKKVTIPKRKKKVLPEKWNYAGSCWEISELNNLLWLVAHLKKQRGGKQITKPECRCTEWSLRFDPFKIIFDVTSFSTPYRTMKPQKVISQTRKVTLLLTTSKSSNNHLQGQSHLCIWCQQQSCKKHQNFSIKLNSPKKSNKTEGRVKLNRTRCCRRPCQHTQPGRHGHLGRRWWRKDHNQSLCYSLWSCFNPLTVFILYFSWKQNVEETFFRISSISSMEHSVTWIHPADTLNYCCSMEHSVTWIHPADTLSYCYGRASGSHDKWCTKPHNIST